PKSLTRTPTRRPCFPVRIRFSSVVFPAPRKPVRIVIGTALPLSSMIFIVQGCLPKRRPLEQEPGSFATRPRSVPSLRDSWTTLLCWFLVFAQVDSHYLRHREEIDLLRVREFCERLAVHVRRIVLLRINLEVARPLLLLLFTRESWLWDDT